MTSNSGAYAMTVKEIGKIASARFGFEPEYTFLMGMFLSFSGPSWGIADGGKYALNTNATKLDIPGTREVAMFKMLYHVRETLEAAKVTSIDQLVGKPVEVTMEDNTFKSFRILTEVL